jgi:hypothetical protein
MAAHQSTSAHKLYTFCRDPLAVRLRCPWPSAVREQIRFLMILTWNHLVLRRIEVCRGWLLIVDATSQEALNMPLSSSGCTEGARQAQQGSCDQAGPCHNATCCCKPVRSCWTLWYECLEKRQAQSASMRQCHSPDATDLIRHSPVLTRLCDTSVTRSAVSNIE